MATSHAYENTKITRLHLCEAGFFIRGYRAPARDRDVAKRTRGAQGEKNNLSPKAEVFFYHIKFDLAASPLSIKISCAVIDLLTAAMK